MPVLVIVCPKGWTLPTKDNYVTLIDTTYGIGSNTAGSTKLRSAPLDFAINGYYSYTGSLSGASSEGDYWSRTVRSSSDTYSLSLYSNYVNPQVSTSRGHGFPLRCTAK